MFKVIIAGGRDFKDSELLERTCNGYLQDKADIEIVSGGAKGADELAIHYSKKYKFELTVIPANWTLYGKSAGPIRNRKMAMYADALIVFWDGKSRGSKNMIETAKEFGIPVRVCKY